MGSRSPYDRKWDPDLMRKYEQQVEESGGFDVDIVPGDSVAFITPLSIDKYYAKYAEAAIKEYNKREETNFEMPELVKVNGLVSGYPIYYMTLRAKDKETNITETFVARVAQLPYNRNVESSIAVKLVELKSLYKNTDNAGFLRE